MSPKAKKILITTEKHEQTLVHFKRDQTAEGFCPECNEVVMVVSLDDGARSLKVGTREALRSIDAGTLHMIESGDGIIALCGRSLAVRLAE